MLTSPTQQIQRDYAAYLALSRIYGSKLAGLSFLPSKWRLDLAAISVEVHRYWKRSGTVSTSPEWGGLVDWLKGKSVFDIIVRSSGVTERLGDRGKFKSIIVKAGWTVSSIETALVEIFLHAGSLDDNEELAIILQEYLRPDYSGHLSNEHRVSPTINQWSYELEKPRWVPSRGINSKFTTAPDPGGPLRCGNQIPHHPLRSVAHYLADGFKERCHVEWIVSRNTLYLTQIDFEWPEHDVGLDPRSDIKQSVPERLDLSFPKILKPYVVGTPTRWPKLRNLSEFDFSNDRPAPRIYPLCPKIVKSACECKSKYCQILDEIAALTGDKLVVRTDCIKEEVEKFNLPRTDTVNARSALQWCRETIRSIEASGIDENSYIFLFHAFLPSLASAWAYAKPGNPIVIVDALWGLPDGLQVLPVDTYEVNVAQKKVVQTRSTFKPRFLTKLEDGTWDYRNIRSRCGRIQVLSNADKIEVALRTKNIADKIDEEAQIMWFCGIPDAYQVGRNVPWFRSRERFDPAPRHVIRHKPVLVSKPDDLNCLPEGKVTIRLSPQANLIRDESFLNQIIDVAKRKDVPVQVDGSILGHTFYRLNQEGVSVVLTNTPKYYRKRGRRSFGKLVRDKIPASIVAGGEVVKEARLVKADLGVALAGKMIEELEELLKASTREERFAELSDVLEVVRGLASAYDLDWGQVEDLAKGKASERGGFRDGRVLIETAMPSRNSPLDEVKQLKLADLGIVQSRETIVEVMSSGIMGTVIGIGVIFSFEGDPLRYSVSVKEGKFRVAKLDRADREDRDLQGDLFDIA